MTHMPELGSSNTRNSRLHSARALADNYISSWLAAASSVFSISSIYFGRISSRVHWAAAFGPNQAEVTGETRAQILDVVKLLEAYRLLAVAGLVWFIIAFVR